MTDYRAMCAELLAWAERTSSHYYKQADVIVRARALLAEADGREPASVAMQPSDNAIAPPLSPAAKAVLQAACIHHGLFNEEIVQRRRSIAAALRAAADQAVPLREAPRIRHDAKRPTIEWHIWDACQQSRSRLLAIAAELEAL